MTDPEEPKKIFVIEWNTDQEVELCERAQFPDEFYLYAGSNGSYLTRPDLEAMHRAIGDYLERTKPQPGPASDSPFMFDD